MDFSGLDPSALDALARHVGNGANPDAGFVLSCGGRTWSCPSGR